MKDKITEDGAKPLLEEDLVAFVTNHITKDGKKIGYMHREAPDFEEDSGWRLFSGKDYQKYIDDDRNVDLLALTDVAKYDSTIVAHLHRAEGTELEWSAEQGDFIDITPKVEEL